MAAFDTILAGVLLGVILTTAATSIRAYARAGRDLSSVHGSAVLGPLIRSWHFENLRPLEDWCVRAGVSATAISYAQFIVSLAVGAAYAGGMFFTAGWLLLATGSLDVVDGRVARRTGTGSAQGAFLDSVIDRYADSFTYMGLAIYFHDSWILWVVLFGLLGGSMVSYTRARAESLGIECRVGLLQRPERTVILGFGSMFSTLLDHLGGAQWGANHALLIATLVAMAVLSNVSAAHRALHVRRQLEGKAGA